MEALYRMSESTASASRSAATQVGGHGGVMSDASGSIVMKPATTREIAFYQLMASAPPPHRPPPSTQAAQQASTSSTSTSAIPNPAPPSSKYDRLSQRQLLGELKRFLPRFYGTLRLEGQVGKEGDVTPVGETPESIVLQDLSHPYTHPCILDIKLGTKLYDRDASEAKKLRMEKKAKECSSWDTGMRMTGFQNWDPIKGKMITTGKPYGYSLSAEKLPEGFRRFFPLAHQVQGEMDGDESTNEGATNTLEPAVAQGAVAIEAGSSKSTGDTSTEEQSTVTPTPTLSPETIERSRRSLIKTLRALHSSVSELYDLMSRLEIELIGSSLLIVYEGDLDALERAWESVEREGQGRGDGLDGYGRAGKSWGHGGDDDSDDDDEFGSDEDGIEGEEIVPGDYDPSGNSSPNRPVVAATTTSKPGWFSGLIGGFGAEKKDGSTGFGLLDSSPPRRSARSARQRKRPSGSSPTRSRSPSPSPSSDDEDSNPSDDSDDEDTRPRPFTLRLIDFAHTRLVQGQGKDEGFLLGLESTMRLIKGRLGELEKDAKGE